MERISAPEPQTNFLELYDSKPLFVPSWDTHLSSSSFVSPWWVGVGWNVGQQGSVSFGGKALNMYGRGPLRSAKILQRVHGEM